MNNILTIFKKEILDTFRDKRTLITMIVVPLLLIPVLMTVVSSFQKKQMESAQAKDLTIAIESNGNGAAFVQQLKQRKDMKIVEGIDPVKFNDFIKEDSLDLALVIEDGFDTSLRSGKTADLTVFYNSTDESAIVDRIETAIERYNNQMLNQRLDSLNTTKAMINPIKTSKKDVYTASESIGKMIGGFLPYLFVMFCFMGGMYPAIDLFTGEKERGTMETILTAPTSRLQILLGKMMVVVLAGVISGLLTIVGMYIAMNLNSDIPQEFLNVLNVILSPKVIILIILMLIPLTTFFAGILIPASIYSKSFKEAQSLIQPMAFVIIMPLIMAMLPSFQLSYMTAMVPILNVALACKEIIADTIDYGHLAVVFVSLFAIAAIGIAVCIRWFGKEGNILRT